MFCFILVLKQSFSKLSPFLAEKCVLQQIPFWVEYSVLPNFHNFSLKTAFCIKSTLGIKLFLKNCVLLHCGLKRAFCQIDTMSSVKMRFATDPLIEYTTHLPNFHHFSPKNAEKCILPQIHS